MPAQHLPFVSIVMPVRNEGDFIESSLLAILLQTYPPALLEVIIADGLSTDDTRARIEKLKTTTNISVKIIDNPKNTAPCGLNLAIAEAKGDIIIRVDGHCEISAHYVENCVRHLMSGEAECVGGPIETIGESLRAKAIAAAMSSRFGVGGSAFRCVTDRRMLVDTVAFPAYRREILEKNGAFNEELVRNQDDEFNYRIRKNGGRILLAPDVVSRYYSRNNFKSLWRQYFQYGYWKIRVLQLHPAQMSLRQFVPFAFVTALILASVFAVFSDIGKYCLAGLAGSYLIANLAAAAFIARRIKFSALPSISLSFAILHFSYGFGFIAGLFAFRRKWNDRRPPASALKMRV